MRAFLWACLLSALAVAPAAAQVPAGAEFQINTYTPYVQGAGRAAMHSSGEFTVTWTSDRQDGYSFGVFAQRYRADGARAGGEFQVNTDTTSVEALSDVALAPNGHAVIVWHGAGSPGFDIHAQRYLSSGAPTGGEFIVNTYTSGNEYRPKVAPLPGGGFVVAWSGHAYPGTDNRILARRYDAFGIPLGPEFQVSAPTPGVFTNFPAIASAADGSFVVVWKDSLGSATIAARLYDATGNPAGPQLVVESLPVPGDNWPDVAMAGDGTFVVVWEHPNDGSTYGIRGRVFSPAGTPLGAEFTANAYTTGAQRVPAVAVNRVGDFVVSWSSRQAGAYDVIARRFSPTGAPRSGDFRVNTFTTGNQTVDDVASDPVGNFVVTWASANQDGGVAGAFGQRFGGLLPAALAVDTASSPQSDGNGVMEPGEGVAVRPSWRNVNGAAQAFTGTMPLFIGLPGATYTITDAAASYGTVANGATAPCSDCYGVSVSAPNPEELARRGVVSGCGGGNYCPADPVTREQMGVFICATFGLRLYGP